MLSVWWKGFYLLLFCLFASFLASSWGHLSSLIRRSRRILHYLLENEMQWEIDFKHCNRKHQRACLSCGKFVSFCCNILRNFGLILSQSQTWLLSNKILKTSAPSSSSKNKHGSLIFSPLKEPPPRGPRSTQPVLQMVFIVLGGGNAVARFLDPAVCETAFKSEGVNSTGESPQMFHKSEFIPPRISFTHYSFCLLNLRTGGGEYKYSHLEVHRRL